MYPKAGLHSLFVTLFESETYDLGPVMKRQLAYTWKQS